MTMVAFGGSAVMRPRRRGASLVATLIAASLLLGCDSAEERAASHFKRGLELVSEGADDKAALEFRNALRLMRDMAAARLELGKLQERQNNPRAAVGNYRAVIELEPENAQAHLRLGALLMAAGELDAATPHVESAATLSPGDAEARAIRAMLLLRRGDATAAVLEAEAALVIDPDSVAANGLIASERALAGDLPAAVNKLDAMIARAPQEIAYRLLRLRLAEQMEDSPTVGAQLEALTAMQPEVAGFRRALAQWKLREGDLDGAEAELRALVDIEGTEGLTRLIAFQLRHRDEATARAELAARVAAAADPETTGALRMLLADFEAQVGNPDAGLALLREIAASDAPRTVVDAARLRLARATLAEGDMAGALALVELILAGDSENSDALAIRAAVAIDELRVDDAIADLRLAQRGDPRNPRLMMLEATAQERSGNATAAAERLAAAARSSDFAPDIALRYASFLRARGELSAANAALSESVRRNPSDRRILAALAEIRLILNDWVGAEEAATALRAIEDGGTMADQVSAASLRGQGRIAESIAILERTLEGENRGALTTLFATFMRAGETDRALALIDDALARDPANRQAQLLRAELHLLQGEQDLAIAKLQQMIDDAPQDAAGYIAMTRLFLSAGLPERGESVARVGVAAAPDSQPLRLLLAQLLELRGDYAAAVAEYESLFERNPDSLVVANNLASLVAEHMADDQAALERAARVAQRLRGYDVPHFKDTYGWIQFLRGEHATALPILIEAAAALPDNAIVRYHAGEAYAAVGRREEARRELETALALDPASPTAEAVRRRLAELAATP